MNDKEKLIKTLKNNLDKGSTSITLDIKYLLSVLQTASDRASNTPPTTKLSPNIDGGNF